MILDRAQIQAARAQVARAIEAGSDPNRPPAVEVRQLMRLASDLADTLTDVEAKLQARLTMLALLQTKVGGEVTEAVRAEMVRLDALQDREAAIQAGEALLRDRGLQALENLPDDVRWLVEEPAGSDALFLMAASGDRELQKRLTRCLDYLRTRLPQLMPITGESLPWLAGLEAMTLDARVSFIASIIEEYCQHCGSSPGAGCVCRRDE